MRAVERRMEVLGTVAGCTVSRCVRRCDYNRHHQVTAAAAAAGDDDDGEDDADRR